MGWFDKKSWQLRRKIRDLQSELAQAERDGKYLVEQGLFFAELQEMGESTLMVLGTADHLDSEEETIVRNFLERNGFSVEKLRLDSSGRTLAAVEIIPPHELTRRVAKDLKEAGFKLLDDSDQERESQPEDKLLTLSGIVRAITALFATFVNQLIINNEPIKMNMEGNRLLHWMPLIRDVTGEKVGQELISLCRGPFVDAYNLYYGQLGRMENPELLERLTEETSPPADLIGAFEAAEDGNWAADSPADGEIDGRSGAEIDAVSLETLEGSAQDVKVTMALAKAYKGLIGASPEQSQRNSEAVLDIIANVFEARSACLIVRAVNDGPFKVRAHSSGMGCLITDADGKIRGDTATLDKAIESQQLTIISGSENGSIHARAAVMPLVLPNGAKALIMLAEPKESDNPEGAGPEHLQVLASVFREFPDLLVPGIEKKPETAESV